MTNTKTLNHAYTALSNAIASLLSVPMHRPVEEITEAERVRARRAALVDQLNGRIRKGTSESLITMAHRLVDRAEEVVESRRDRRATIVLSQWETACAFGPFSLPANNG